MIIAIQQIINHKNLIHTGGENEVSMSPIQRTETWVDLRDGYTMNEYTM